MNTVRNEVLEGIKDANQRGEFTARMKVIRPATYGLDTDIMDKADWYITAEGENGPRPDVLQHVAICCVEVLRNGVPYCTLPKRHPIYECDEEYLRDTLTEAIDTIAGGVKAGVLK